ncbi:MAG: hypothetical protein JWN99_1579 [Ilumatobacteraceae bacterium]|nr:hypothetical protein [Ilumatobacteraceae bacterium]
MTDVYDEGQLAVFERQIDEWLAAFHSENPAIEAVDRGDGDDLRWYVRMHGEAKEHTTVWLTLNQRTLQYEAYVMPAPLENLDAVYESALRRNERMVGAHFAIGVEDALFLRGELPLVALCEAELDRVIGSLYAYVEQSFPSLIRLGYASHFATVIDDQPDVVDD